jgi:hypothetical protein
VFVCSLKFSFPQGLAANTTQAQLKQFFHLTAVPFKESEAGCKTHARAQIPAAGKPITDTSLWCPYAEMEYEVELLPDSFVEVRSLELMPRMRYKLWFEEAGALSSCLRGNCVDVNHVVMSGQSSQTWILFTQTWSI